MLPQLDSSYYISQFFWLSVCFGILIFAFKKVFIPRMNALIDKRDSAIEKGRENVAILTEEISKLEQEISNLKNLELKRSAEIIKEASRKSEKILSEQLSTLKKENEELTAGLRKRFKDDVQSLNSTFKIQIVDTAQILYDRVFSKQHG